MAKLRDDDECPYDSDSDSALWWAYRQDKKRRRNNNFVSWEESNRQQLQEILGPSRLVKHSDYHYSFLIGTERVDFWPSTNKWRMKKKTYFGNFRSLCNFVRKRLPKPESEGQNNAG